MRTRRILRARLRATLNFSLPFSRSLPLVILKTVSQPANMGWLMEFKVMQTLCQLLLILHLI